MESPSTSSQTFPIQQSDIKFSDLAGLAEQKQALTEFIKIPLQFPQLFSGLRRPYTGFFLYGPPGVGKTLLAKACAGEFGMGYILVQTCHLIGKLIGESERTLREIFENAKKAENPVIIIMDEIDAMMHERKDLETPRRLVTEFLIQMDRKESFVILFDNFNEELTNEKSPSQVFVIATANMPWDLYPPAKKRLNKRIYLPLADFNTRKELFEMKLCKVPNALKADNFLSLAQITEGYSSQDLAVIINEAISCPIREITKATHFKKIENQYFACPETDPEAQNMTIMEIPPEELGANREISIGDIKREIEKVKPSVLLSDIIKYEQFKENFGG